MAQGKELKRRIASIGSTAKITKAMEMIAASKMQKAQDKAKKTIPYTTGIYNIVSKFANIKDFKSVYLRRSESVKNVVIVVIGSNRGFVGGLIANMTSAVYKFTQNLKRQNPELGITGISIHKTALKIVTNAGLKSDFHFQEEWENLTTTDLSAVYSAIIESFKDGKYDEVYLAYSHFINTMTQKPLIKRILPISLTSLVEEAEASGTLEDTEDVEKVNKFSQKEEFSNPHHNPFLFEPSMSQVLNVLLPEYFQTQIYSAILEGFASEHSARMISMKNATDNAIDLQKVLTIKYNRQRQAAITQELIEVISGS